MKNDWLTQRETLADADAERMVLGVLILDNGLLDQVLEKLTPVDFYIPSNRRIFEAMLRLEGKGSEFDPLLIQRELESSGDLERVGGQVYIASLFDGVPRLSDVRPYVALIEGASLRRQLLHAGDLVMKSAYDFESSAEEQVSRAQKVVCDVQSRSNAASWVGAGELAYNAFVRIENRAADGRLITGLATGFTDFDYMTGGLQRKELYVVGGRPKMGKTAWVGSLLTNVGEAELNRRNDQPPISAFFSLEMSKELISERMLAGLSHVDLHRLKSGMVNANDFRALSLAVGRMESLGLEIDDSPALTPTMMRSKLRQIQQRRGGLDLVVVDYLQMMQPDKRYESTLREVSEVSRALKAVGKEFDVPVVALASLSRKCEERTDKRPIPSDLRESGSIESDADLIAFIYRDAVYNQNAEPNLAELIVRAHRNGPTGTVNLLFRGGISRFDNLERSYE